MKSLSKTATQVFLSLIEGLHSPGDSRKIDNTDGTFMAVHVELIHQNQHGRHFSIAHYYEQNGDLMCDPDMTFLVTSDTQVFPMTFRQDGYFQINQVAVFFPDESLRYYPKMQADITRFANTWMKNIRNQQKKLAA